MPTKPSRSRFSEYRQSVRDRHTGGQRPPNHGHGDRNPKKLGERDRKFRELFLQFLALTTKHRGQIITALGLLTIGIGLRLIPPLGTKLAIDSALTSPPKTLAFAHEPNELATCHRGHRRRRNDNFHRSASIESLDRDQSCQPNTGHHPASRVRARHQVAAEQCLRHEEWWCRQFDP